MKRFTIVENGYDINEVNKFVDIVISKFERLNNDNIQYSKKIEELNKHLGISNNNDISRLENVIFTLEEINDKLKETSKKEADAIIDEAKNNANTIINEALMKFEDIEHEKMILEKNINIYKKRVKLLIEEELKLINDFDTLDL